MHVHTSILNIDIESKIPFGVFLCAFRSKRICN